MAIHPDHAGQSFDCNLQVLMARKRRLAKSVLHPMGNEEACGDELWVALQADDEFKTRRLSAQEILKQSMQSVFNRSEMPFPTPDGRGAWRLAA